MTGAAYDHWTPEQVVTFVASFLDSEVIPSLILWKSPMYIFVIDGGHRLSALRAWMGDDYGDNAISLGGGGVGAGGEVGVDEGDGLAVEEETEWFGLRGVYVSGLQPSVFFVHGTWAFGPGWYVARPWRLVRWRWRDG